MNTLDNISFQDSRSFKIFAAGDVVGRPGRRILSEVIPLLKKKGFDCIIINGENAAGGSGVTSQIANKIFSYGADVITSGDHFFKNQKILPDIHKFDCLLRPPNYPEGVPGRGYCIVQKEGDIKVAVINLLGRTFINIGDCPFEAMNRILDKLEKDVKIIIVDFHAEATSEKQAMGWFLDGRVSLLFGTHTHIPTADEKILPQGTAYITDIGMTGGHASVLGREIAPVLKRFTMQIPFRFSISEEDLICDGLIAEFDRETGKAIAIQRIQLPYTGESSGKENE